VKNVDVNCVRQVKRDVFHEIKEDELVQVRYRVLGPYLVQKAFVIDILPKFCFLTQEVVLNLLLISYLGKVLLV